MKLYQGCCVCLSIINQWCDFRFKVHFIRCLLFSSLYLHKTNCIFVPGIFFSLPISKNFHFCLEWVLLLNFATDLFYFFFFFLLLSKLLVMWGFSSFCLLLLESRWGELKALTFNHCGMPVTINARIFGNGRNVFVLFFFFPMAVS